MENKPLDQLHAHDRLLVLLKSGGPTTTAELASKLGITGEAARQQLQHLQQEGMLEATTESHGRGRPAQVWKLTAAANKRFPDAHAELAAQLIHTIQTALGEPALERVIEARAQDVLGRYRLALKHAVKLEDRVRGLVSLRNADGYMAECRAEQGGYLIIENHCPICAASGVCLKLCHSELELFSKLLGPKVRVDREENIVNGSRRCVYRIRRSAPERAPGPGRKGGARNSRADGLGKAVEAYRTPGR